MALPALEALENAGRSIQKANKALDASPAHQAQLAPAVEELVTALYSLETRAHHDLSQRAQRPLPAPNPNEVGAWAANLRQNRAALAPIMPLSPPQWILEEAAHLRGAAGQVIQALERPPVVQYAPEPEAPPPPAPVRQTGFGNPASVAVAAVASTAKPAVSRKAIGIMLQLAAAAGTALMGYGMTKWEKKLLNDGLAVDEDEEPFQVRQRSQKVLDSEMPGASMTLTSAPDGEWIASVKRGTDTIARVPAKKPHNAAADAIRRALEYDEARRHEVDGELIGQTIDVTPSKSRHA